MASESPFSLTKVECPICGTINEFETIKAGAYSHSGRDTDFCPTGRTWGNPRYQAYNPLLYFVATCTNCFYTREFNNSFKEWKEDHYFTTFRLKVVKERHLEALSRSDSVIKAMGQELDSDRYPGETAILKILLAILDEALNDRRVELDLARFYLRVAWLFRDMEREEDSNRQIIKSYLIDIDKKNSEVKNTLDVLRKNARDLEQAVASQFEDERISGAFKSILYPVKDEYDTELTSFGESLSVLAGKLDSLEALSNEHKKLALGSGEYDALQSFHDHRSFRDFLASMAGACQGIPLNEKEAIKHAVAYYKSAFEDGREIGGGNRQIQASYLIAELSRRIGDSETAREYFNTTIRTGQEFIHQNQGDQSRTALARKILELAIEQGRSNLAEAETTR